MGEVPYAPNQLGRQERLVCLKTNVGEALETIKIYTWEKKAKSRE